MSDAGGFSQTSPIPAPARLTPLVHQIASTTNERAEVADANPAKGEITLLGPAVGTGAPAIARVSDAPVVAWPAQREAPRSAWSLSAADQRRWLRTRSRSRPTAIVLSGSTSTACRKISLARSMDPIAS